MLKRLLFVLVLCITSNVLADGLILPLDVTQSYMQVRYHHVNVTIDGLHAITEVEQEFVNPLDAPVAGQYIFPIPPDMILSDIHFTLDSVVSAPTRQDVTTTNDMIYRMVAERRDPSLLQYLDWETLALNINLEPHGSQKMSIRYEEVLTPQNNTFHYRYILSTERYTSMPLDSVSITVDIQDEATNIYSPSHALVTQQNGRGSLVTWTAQYVQPNENFDLFFTPAEEGFGGMMLTGTHKERGHFLFLFSPEANTASEDTLPKDIVFVIDRSGSMDGEKIVQAQSALKQILGRLNENDRFSIVGFDDLISVFADRLQPVNTDKIREALAFVDTMTARNATDIGLALDTGLRIFQNSETRSTASQMVIFLTDGLPTAGLQDEASILNLVESVNQGAHIHVFGVGYDVNTHLLDRLASNHSGAVTYVQPGENLELVMTNFYARISNPVLTDIQITFEGIEAIDLYPQTFPDLFEGSSLTLAGRYTAETDTITVRVEGKAGDEPREYLYTFDVSGNYDFVPRLWATRRVGHLLDIVRVEGETANLKEEIQGLGLDYGIITPYTTFIITPQTDGPASESNMSLYNDQAALNQTSGAVTVQARVQNMMYQEANQVGVVTGANIVNVGNRPMAQVGTQYVDLSLLADNDGQTAVTNEWIDANIQPDQVITFGSEEYFTLAANPETRAALQSGTNVLFSYNGQTILVKEAQ